MTNDGAAVCSGDPRPCDPGGSLGTGDVKPGRSFGLLGPPCCPASALLTGLFGEFALPRLPDSCARIGNAFHHPDGVGQLPHLDHGDWQSVQSGVVGPSPPAFLQNLARHKGFRVYSESDAPMYFRRSLAGMHAGSDGVKETILPREATVTSLWDGQTLGRARRFSRPTRTGDKALHPVEP